MKTETMNGSAPQTVADLMSNPAAAMPTQTLADHNILPAKTISSKATDEPAKRSTSADKGIPTTVGNLQILAETVELFEPAYTDNGNASLTPTHLKAMHTQASLLVTNVAEKVNLNKIEIDIRMLLFFALPQLATCIINALIACGASKETVHNARYFVNKIQGVRVVKINPDETDKKNISVSQQSYVQLVQHFEGLIIVVSDEPLYDPSTGDLKVVNLQAKLVAMKAANSSVTMSQAVLNIARMDRNTYFNEANAGLVDVCLTTKNNVKAIFGATSAQYQMVSSLAFTRIKVAK